MTTFTLRAIPELPEDGVTSIVSLVRGRRDDFSSWREDVRKAGNSSDLDELLTIMSRVCEGQPVPPDRYKPLKGRKQTRFGEYEFKYKRLRVYACRTPDGRLHVCAAYQDAKKSKGGSGATNQQRAIARFRTLVDELPDDLEALDHD